MSHFHQKLTEYRFRVENTLTDVLADPKHSHHRLNQAMIYSTLNGGKRLRPILVYATGECLGQQLELLDYAAAAIECIHCYSLIHDDLPVMDNDSLRRGKPTCHIAFDITTAILAGDALQSLAFECLSRYQDSSLSPKTQLRLFSILAHKIGKAGMVKGQLLDLESKKKTLTPNELEMIHQLKTGALIEASVQLGAIAAGCEDSHIFNLLHIFSNQLGLAFQLQDDLLDVIDQDVKDQQSTKKRIQTLTENAIQALKTIPMNTDFLQTLCLYLMRRER